jgi:four helix bundle protein
MDNVTNERRGEDLKRRTKRFSLDVIRLCEQLPQRPSARVIANQLLRSATSVGANYRSAFRSRSNAEFIAKLGIVLEEADESVYWIELLCESGLVPRPRIESLLLESEELVAIFAASRLTASGKGKC